MKKNYAMLNTLLFVLICFTSCNGNNDKTDSFQPKSAVNVRKNIEKANKILIEKDKDKIESFLRRHNLQAIFDSTGFWFVEIEKGNGTKIENGALVALQGAINLIDGTPCYTYAEDNPLVFVVGKSNELSEVANVQNAVSGLHSALVLMENQSRYVFVFPPHLAHGIIGDGNNIPPRSILIYDIKVLDVK
ncbi:MAG: FKBP-type peptidyl-prolyl cis-trans isomerase [Prevotellaceae bacterium]|jgi:FKBP-type peptidyl-prolyl cis-trans isomerase|nr:FKBP-type peptidyl-prolyl cis-trans isomerase [Prevotellaceae bacterium]